MTATQPKVGAAGAAASRLEVREVRDQVGDAVARGRSLRIVAGGSWLDANRPVHADATLLVSNLSDIVEYEPGDLTLTARAGTTLDAIARVTAEHGQWLALDPPGDPTRATIGAAVSTASYGPLAHHFGTPRDMTLGVEFVTAAGSIVRGGGRVVKNVAGYDLTRLVTGAWGSLGVLTEVTVRLRAAPAVEATIAVDVPDALERVDILRSALRALPFTPLAAQWLDRRIASSAGIDAGGAVVLVRLGGNEEAVRAQRAALEPLGGTREIERAVWDRLRIVEPARTASFRLSRLPSDFAKTWMEARRLIEQWPDAYCHGDAGRGVVRCVLPLGGRGDDSGLRGITGVPFTGTRIFERLPHEAWSGLAPAVRTPLERRVKAAFDPRGIFNPGILGESQ